MARRQEKYEQYGLTAQPVPIWVGSFQNIDASYVNINDQIYKVESPVKAIDVCFKLYFALEAKYPPEATLPWLLIQKGIYNISESLNGEDKKYVSLSLILSELKKYF